MIYFILLLITFNTCMANNLTLCPETPNCVCSLEKPFSDKYVEPILSSLPQEESVKKIVDVINSFTRTKIIKQEKNYIHATFKTFLGFTDDVEFLIEKDLIHFRSASRTGYYDFQKNKKRYIEIVKRLNLR